MSSSDSNDSYVENWLTNSPVSQSDMNNVVMNYLMIEGYKEAAEKFREEARVDFDTDPYSASIDDRIRIHKAILDGLIPEAIAMINDLDPDLLDDNDVLHFRLLQQQMIEYIRQNRTDEALTFAQQNLAEKGENNPEVLSELEQTLALLAFDQPEQSLYSDLLSPCQHFRVASDVNAAILASEDKEGHPKLESLVKFILWAQEKLDDAHVKYPKMIDVAQASFECPKKTN